MLTNPLMTKENPSPSGLTSSELYVELEDDIERLVSMKAGLYIIPGYDREDIGQEIRMTCVKALEKWDNSKNNSTPFHYLARCVDNMLRNLLRDKAAALPKSQQDNPKAVARVEKKRKLHYTLSVGHDVDESQLGETPGISSITSEFVEAVRKELDEAYWSSLDILVNSGPPSIPKQHLKIIKIAIREVYS